MTKSLSFKEGVEANLPSTHTPGTIYFTTDTHKFYVATSETECAEANSEIKYFNDFPTELQIKTLPNNSIFAVKAYGNTDEQTELAHYYVTTGWTRNALTYTNDAGGTIYVVPIDQAVGEIYLPYYGIKTGEANAESNSDIMDYITQKAVFGSTLTLPPGHFYFARPINLAEPATNLNPLLSLQGARTSHFQNDQVKGITCLHFPNLTEGQVAITISQATLSDLKIRGNSDSYNLTITRENIIDDTKEPVNEVANVKAYGIYAKGATIVKNVSVTNFYYGMYTETSNIFINDVNIFKCHYGIMIDCDTKINNVFGFDVMTLVQVRGSVSSANNVRGDSVEHLVELTGGSSCTLSDLDADFCLGSIIVVGDGVNSCNVSNVIMNSVHGRSSTYHPFLKDGTAITAQQITEATSDEFGIIAIRNNAKLSGAIIMSNQNPTANPFDGTPAGYITPYVLLSAASNSIAQGVHFIITSDGLNELTTEWAQSVIKSFSSKGINCCDIKVETNNSGLRYLQSGDQVTIKIDGDFDAEDGEQIEQLIGLDNYARNGEVVKTVNNIFPDDDGNVVIEIIEEEPIIVSSADEFVDTTKKYVLDNYIYAYRKQFVPGGTFPNFTNQLPISLSPSLDGSIYEGVGYKPKVQLGVSDGAVVESEVNFTCYTTGLIPVKLGDVIRVNYMGTHTTATSAGVPLLKFFRENLTYVSGIACSSLSTVTNGGGSYTLEGEYGNAIISNFVINVNAETVGWIANLPIGYVTFLIWDTTPPSEVIITVNEEISYTTTEDHYEWSWVNTGKQYNNVLPLATADAIGGIKIGYVDNGNNYGLQLDETTGQAFVNVSGLKDRKNNHVITASWDEPAYNSVQYLAAWSYNNNGSTTATEENYHIGQISIANLKAQIGGAITAFNISLNDKRLTGSTTPASYIDLTSYDLSNVKLINIELAMRYYTNSDRTAFDYAYFTLTLNKDSFKDAVDYYYIPFKITPSGSTNSLEYNQGSIIIGASTSQLQLYNTDFDNTAFATPLVYITNIIAIS